MRPHVQILLTVLLLPVLQGCQPEDIRFEDNPVPAYEGVPTVVVDAYLTRAFIDLIGREPLPQELEEERSALRAGDLETEAREALVDLLTGSAFDTTYLAAHDRKVFDDLTGRFLDGASRESLIQEMEFQRFLATQDSLAGGTAYLLFNLQADRLERTVSSIQEFRAGAIDWREVNRRFCDNSFYDEINMNSFNFVNAAFDDLYGRYPTEAEFEQAYAAVEFGAPSLLFGQVIEDRFDFLDAMVGDPEFEEGAVRWLAEKLLVRPITGAEMVAWRTTAGPDVDIRPLLKLLISSDEYADFE